MKSYTQSFADFLLNNNQFIVCDLYTFTMQVPYWDAGGGVHFNEVVARYTSLDQDVWVNGNQFLSSSAMIERSNIRSNVGVEVDKLSLQVYANDSMLLRGRPFMQACTDGVLDNATVLLERLYMDTSMTPQGTVIMFSGRVSTIKTSRSVAEIEVASDLELLNINMPRKLYQAGCQNTLYDTACNLYASSFSSTLTVGAGSTKTTIYTTSTKASGWFDLGGLIFNSGSNANELRTIKSWDGTKIQLVSPLPYVPSVGETFYAYPGCDKQKGTCGSKFNNVANFRGFPFIPQPETMR